MIEAILITYLSGVLSIPVFAEVPDQPPDQFVLVEKVSGGIRNHIYSAGVAVQCWDKGSLYAAAARNEEVKAALLYGAVPDTITRVSLNTDYNFTDPTTKYYRYQAVYDIIHY